MPIAVFSDGVCVKTDGPNAEKDLAVHTNKRSDFIRIEDKDYNGMSNSDIIAFISANVGLFPQELKNPAPIPIIEKQSKAIARRNAIDLALSQGKSYVEAMQAGQNASDITP